MLEIPIWERLGWFSAFVQLSGPGGSQAWGAGQWANATMAAGALRARGCGGATVLLCHAGGRRSGGARLLQFGRERFVSASAISRAPGVAARGMKPQPPGGSCRGGAIARRVLARHGARGELQRELPRGELYRVLYLRYNLSRKRNKSRGCLAVCISGLSNTGDDASPRLRVRDGG